MKKETLAAQVGAPGALPASPQPPKKRAAKKVAAPVPVVAPVKQPAAPKKAAKKKTKPEYSGLSGKYPGFDEERDYGPAPTAYLRRRKKK